MFLIQTLKFTNHAASIPWTGWWLNKVVLVTSNNVSQVHAAFVAVGLGEVVAEVSRFLVTK